MEVARSLGWVEVRPKTGIRRLPYCFKNTLSQSIQYGHTVDSHLFSYFSDLRKHIEASYWFQAVNGLSATDIQNMEALVFSAEGKLSRNPVQIPHQEHRELHMTIFKKLDNPLVVGILAAYWDLYEMVGYSLYTDLDYLKNVWNYHKKIVNHLKQGELQLGYRALLEHMDLLSQRERTKTGNHFE
jgi:DNA-binding FadR family transcriptional regulator